MIEVKFIVNLDHKLFVLFADYSTKNKDLPVEFDFLDTGSKKDIRKARGYFSKYASSEVFVVIEDPTKEDNKVIDVIYKEEVSKTRTWEMLLDKKIQKALQNEN